MQFIKKIFAAVTDINWTRHRILTTAWIASLIISLANDLWYFLPNAFAVVLPLVFISVSFYVFNQVMIGYRIFHHICMACLALYVAIGLVMNLPKILFGSHVEAMLAYTWFGSVGSTYLFFLVMFGLAYLPYLVYRKLLLGDEASQE